MKERHECLIAVEINGKNIFRLVIDLHYLNKHSGSINVAIILRLVKMLNCRYFESEKIDSGGFEYYVEDGMKLNGRTYKLIWLLKENEDFIGVINCYRRD